MIDSRNWAKIAYSSPHTAGKELNSKYLSFSGRISVLVVGNIARLNNYQPNMSHFQFFFSKTKSPTENLVFPPAPTDFFGSLSSSKSLISGLPNNNSAGVLRTAMCIQSIS